MWSPTKLQITLIGTLIDETYKTMRSAEPDKFKQIGDQFIDIAAGADTTVVQNEQGELALCCEGQYYPIQSGSWVQEERSWMMTNRKRWNTMPLFLSVVLTIY